MKKSPQNTDAIFRQSLKATLFLVFMVLLAAPSFGQNVKGDKPPTNPSGPFLRFPKKIFKSKSADRPHTRDITGRRRIRTKNKSSASNVQYYPRNPGIGKAPSRGDKPAQARGRTFTRPSGGGRQRSWTGDLQGHSQRIRSISAKRARHNVYPATGPYVNHSSVSPALHTRPITRSLSGKRVKLKSASKPYVVRGKKNVYWGKFSKGEKPFTRDLTGRPLRKLNFMSNGIGVGTSDTLKTAHGRPHRERASSGRFAGGFVSATPSGSRPWLGDISGHPIRRRPPRHGESKGVYTIKTQLGSPKRSKKSNQPLRPRAPGIGASGILKSLRSGGRRGAGGGGSVSGKYQKNNRQHIQPRGGAPGFDKPARFQGNFHRGDLQPGIGRQGYGYAGDMRARRTPKGGGSISSKFMKNNRAHIQPRGGAPGFDKPARFQGNFLRGELQPGFGRQGFGYAGDMKTRRPPKGGGSVSAFFMKNNRQHIAARGGAPGFDKPARFQGNFRSRRPPQGGGSVSSKFMKNNREHIPARAGAPGFDKPAHYKGDFLLLELQPGFGRQGFGYSGDIKAKKPKKGGGSISGKMFNNDGKPLEGQAPTSATSKAVRYSGTSKRSRREYVQNPNANKESIKKQKPKPNTWLASGLQVKDKQEKYRKRPHAADNAQPGIGPGKGSISASKYDRAMKMTWSYKHNPKTHDDAMKGIKPKPGLKRLVEFQGSSRLAKDLKHNPSTSKDAMKVLAPGKAYARINDFAGNLKMKKYNDHLLHPDAQFAHGFRNNTKEDRTLLMNFKLFWSKLFKKNDTQPAIVKEKERRPRYDKKEKDLWKALYD